VTTQVIDLLREKGPTVHTVAPSATVYEAIEKMSAMNVGALVVVENGRVSGIITERDYLRKVALKGRSSKTTLVQEIMASRVTYVKPDTLVSDCLRLMNEGRFRYLPVLDESRLVGIVSVGDLIKQVVRDQSFEIEHLTSYICGTYPR
jgi:CBS domain-containing protein